MRSPLSVAALSLALLQSADAINFALQRKMDILADMGFNADGTPMNLQVSGILANKLYPPPPNETIEPEYIQLPLDNFAKIKNQDFSYYGTFNNRYWVSQAAYKPGGPVFLYDVGEANAETNALFRLQNETSFFKQLVEKYNGIGIVWEHRYYGNSTPGPIDVNTPAEVFRWLTTEQSLADVERFANQFSRKDIKYPLTPDKTPWIFVGGSYPAMRAAFMRDQYPDTIFASYASSAPTQAAVDMSYYFEPMVRGMRKYGFGNCTKDIQAAVKYMDKLMENKAEAAKLKVKFLGPGADSNSNPTFADALTSWTMTWQSYGMDGGTLGIRYLCDWIETDPATNKTAGADGWAKTKGPKFTVDRWASYPQFVKMVNQYLETNCSGKANVTSTDCDLNKKFSDPSMVAWTWQYCTQWGYLQSANLGPNQVVSSWNSLEHQKDICHRQFPDAPRSLFPTWPNTDRTNDVFGGWDIRPSNVYWSGGEFDPWRTLSPLSAEPFAPKVRTFTDPPRCGQEQSQREIFGYTIPNAQHCYDFRTYFEPGAISREYFTNALTTWLKCFRPRGKGKPKPWMA